MAEIIPPEDDISKKQLWERIDVLRNVIESHKGETIYKMDTTRETLRMELNNANSDHTLLVHKRMSEIENWLNTFKLEVQRTLGESIKDTKTLFNNHLAEVESNIKDMRDSISIAVKSESQELFSNNEQRITVVEDKFSTLSKDLNDALSRYQVETRTKLGDLKNKIERVISKLRDGFQDL